MRDSDDRPSIVLVAALARNRVIGADGAMPWHLPADLAHFKRVTLGHPVIMGRATFESIGRPLPGRRNIVLSRSGFEAPRGVECVESLDDALDRLEPDRSAMVIGGGQVYAEALPRAARMELTLVDARPDGDTLFPDWPKSDWRLQASEARPADPDNPHRLVFVTLVRREASQESEDD
ncbi:type 3 dihydrofolate reductase [Wenzhouxiangella sp. XN79A]|uniref:type 3 dihydrofolate reductase n=1 Tax=Wenzhouxiangella sp. XN79A TaxID=2724193 RepID=UPI00144A8B98|nr:type 3 dihydrofolate reductase [Wenzhouxiangella sp. XN79A]NKI36501.1 type 3 dihydrofolate reductase [Wenzhouxiangella sp. XN79A]